MTNQLKKDKNELSVIYKIYNTAIIMLIATLVKRRLIQFMVMLTRFVPFICFLALWTIFATFLWLAKHSAIYAKAEFLLKSLPFDHLYRFFQFIDLLPLLLFSVIFSLAYLYKSITKGLFNDLFALNKKPYLFRSIKKKQDEILAFLNTSDLPLRDLQFFHEDSDAISLRWSGISNKIWISARYFDDGKNTLKQDLEYFIHKIYYGIPNLSFYPAVFLGFGLIACKITNIVWLCIFFLVITRVFTCFETYGVIYSDLIYIRKHGAENWSNMVNRTLDYRHLNGIFYKYEGKLLWWLLSGLFFYPFNVPFEDRKKLVFYLVRNEVADRIAV